jgi:LemA protein
VVRRLIEQTLPEFFPGKARPFAWFIRINFHIRFSDKLGFCALLKQFKHKVILLGKERNVKGIAIFGILILVLAAGAAFWYINTRNGLVRLDETINQSMSEIDNQLQRRSDLIPNFVNTVKGYASHEQQIFTDIAEARSRLAGAQTVEEKAAGYNEIQSALSRLLVVVEQYPDLKANQNFTALQDELAGTENRIAVARKRYNDSIGSFNIRIRSFPGSLVANNMGFTAHAYFEIAESAREVPMVEF